MQEINTDIWNRKEIFDFFCGFDEPYFGVTSDVNVTKAYQSSKEKGVSFSVYYLHCTLIAINQVEALKFIILDAKPVKYKTIHGSASSLVLNNNNIVNVSTPAGTGLTVVYRRSGGAASNLANDAGTSNKNNFYTDTLSANRFIYHDGTSSAVGFTPYKNGVFTAGTIAPRDAQSFSENPTFLSTTGSSSNFLHISPLVSTLLESGGSTIVGITDDYDGDTRNVTTPDVSADEFAGLSPAPVITFNSLTPGTNQCVAAPHVVSVTANGNKRSCRRMMITPAGSSGYGNLPSGVAAPFSEDARSMRLRRRRMPVAPDSGRHDRPACGPFPQHWRVRAKLWILRDGRVGNDNR